MRFQNTFEMEKAEGAAESNYVMFIRLSFFHRKRVHKINKCY